MELTWDVLNLLNLIDPDSGVLRYANFNDLLVVRPVTRRQPDQLQPP